VQNFYYGKPCCGPCEAGAGKPDPMKDVAAVDSADKPPEPFYVAESNDGTCQDLVGQHGRWLGHALFTVSGNVTYCGYTWTSDPLAPPEPGLFADASVASNLANAEPDEPVLATLQAPPLAPTGPSDEDVALWLGPLHRTARTRFGLDGVTQPVAHAAGVRVALIDSASGDFDRVGEYRDPSGHGTAVGRVIQEVACAGQAACRVSIKPYPALTITTTGDVMQASGSGAGAYGTRFQLAWQISRAVDEWLSGRGAAGAPAHLVINLSLGWSGCWDMQRERSLDSRMVRDAIERASCLGALVVAAGGNRDAIRGCPGQPDRLGEHSFPGLWAGREQRPSAEACKKVGVGAARAGELGPFLLGVSAVDDRDLPLGVAQQESSLVAYGGAVVMPDGDGTWTKQRSGTSMSAAAVSGIAAAIWATYPERSAAQVERDLIEPAVLLRAHAGAPFICNSQSPPLAPNECESVRRASLCLSLAHAANVSASPEQCGPPKADPDDAMSFGAMSAPAMVDVTAVDCAACDPATMPCSACNPAPGGVDPAEQPWAVVGPQPDGDACGTCVINKSKNRFEAKFKDSWARYMSDVTVVFYPSQHEYTVRDGAVSAGTTYRVGISSSVESSTSAILSYSYKKPGGKRIDYIEEIAWSANGVIHL
jgi:subtilisin family serine protease